MTTIHLRQDVSIGPLRPEYAEAMYRWVSDPVVSQNLGLRHSPSMERTLAWLHRVESAKDMRGFAVHLKNHHVGNVVIDQVDEYLAMGRLSVYIGESTARAARVGTTGIYLALQQSFADLNLHKIWLTVHNANYPAINVYNKLGFVLEGILRDEFWLRGVRVPALYMGLLRSDFEALSVEWEDIR